jgi:site-specific DNA-methyltransferase (adenine-specific)
VNKLLFGPCEDLMYDIPEKSIDLILCDLPYEITDCEWDVKIDFGILWKHYNRIRKENTPIILFANQPFTSGLINSNLKMYRYNCNWYWIKNNSTGFPFAKVQPMRCVEDVCVFYEKVPIYNPIGIRSVSIKKCRKYVTDSVYKSKTLVKKYVQQLSGYPNNLLYFETDVIGENRYHETQKPVRLLEYLIRTYSNLGDMVLDNTMGSGSTGVASTNTGRNFIGIEKKKSHFDNAVKRITEAEKLNSSSLFDIVTLEGSYKPPPPRTGKKFRKIFLNDHKRH